MIGALVKLESIQPQQEVSEIASWVAECILGQIDRVYPCYSSQVLGSPQELELPEQRFCVFKGSFDWHSCVHSHWSLVRFVRTHVLGPELHERCVRVLQQHFVKENVEKEAQAWKRLPAHEEMPYGVAWLLTLQAELATPEISVIYPNWSLVLQPLVDVLAPRVLAWIEGTHLPVRSGIHSDTAWSLALIWDWACAFGFSEFKDAVQSKAVELFEQDKNAPCAYEPSGQTFTSPILNEAALMARVLDKDSYNAWLEAFLPQVFRDDFEAPLLGDIKTVWDGKDYYGVHEVALPLSRAIAARDAATCATGAAQKNLFAESLRWQKQGLDTITLKGHLADHWVGSFVTAAILP
ncbi:MAG: DUF2891 family protein [Coriobacteriales bacterium]|nr:DUF2891 family protein [Coriobacteriales bacterium]